MIAAIPVVDSVQDTIPAATSHLDWETLSTVVSAGSSMVAALAALAALVLAVRHHKAQVAARRVELRSSAYRKVVSEPTQLALDRFFDRALLVLRKGAVAIRNLHEEGADEPALMEALRDLSQRFNELWTDLAPRLTGYAVAWGETPELRSHLRNAAEGLQAEVLLEIGKLAIESESEAFDSLLASRCGAIQKVVLNHDPGFSS